MEDVSPGCFARSVGENRAAALPVVGRTACAGHQDRCLTDSQILVTASAAPPRAGRAGDAAVALRARPVLPAASCTWAVARRPSCRTTRSIERAWLMDFHHHREDEAFRRAGAAPPRRRAAAGAP